MVRRSTITTKPERPHHTPEEKRQDMVRLRRRIGELEAFDPSQATKRFSDPTVTAIEAAIGATLVSIFGEGTVELRRYHPAAKLDHGVVVASSTWGRGYQDQAAEARRYLTEGKAASLALLGQAVRALEEEIEFAPAAAIGDVEEAVPAMPGPRSNRVFVVHGHDDGARETVARFLEQIGLEAIILHEQANRGRTVMEKIEAHGDVDFAVVLLTPDDEGRAVRGGELEPRARQNVLLELGYFIGRLGRARVCALKRGQVEIPSDFAGVVWELMDDSAGWKMRLGRELQDAGYPIDWNRVMAR